MPHLKIGNIIFKNGLALAPMAGVTDSVFRRICKSFGAEYMVSEMISAKAIVYRDSKTPELAKMRSEERPMALQIFGSDSSVMAEAASWLYNNFHPDVIDINMGCPVRKIVGNGDGSALMKSPEKAKKMSAL